MAGKIRRKLILNDLAQLPVIEAAKGAIFCPLCSREIPFNQRDAHHLIPKSKGGLKTEFLHRICHRQIHALLSETEIATNYNSVEQLLTHPEIQKFVFWVKTKPNHLHERTYKSQRLRPK